MKNEVLFGDCLELMQEIPNHSIDFILTDLPYGVLNKGNKHSAWDKPVDLQKLWTQYWRILKPNGVVALFGQGMFTADLMHSQKRYWKYNWVWEKIDGVTGFLNAQKEPLRCTEDICIFYQNRPTYHPQMEENTGRFNHGQRFKSDGNKCYGKMSRKTPSEITDTHYPKNLLRFPRDNARSALYPAQKPVALLRYLIRTYTNEGDTVLDSCVGSGSTRIAAYEENRNFIGYEINPVAFDLQKKRYEDHIAQLSLFVGGAE